MSANIAELERRLAGLEVGGDAELRKLRQTELLRIATWLTNDVQPRLAAQVLAVQPDDGKGGLARRGRQTRRRHHDLGQGNGGVLKHQS